MKFTDSGIFALMSAVIVKYDPRVFIFLCDYR